MRQGHGTGQKLTVPSFGGRIMNVDAIHTALGLTFTAIATRRPNSGREPSDLLNWVSKQCVLIGVF